MNFLRTRPRKVAVGVGAGLGIAAVAFAAVLLSSSIGGKVSFADSTTPPAATTSAEVSVSGTVGDGGMDCTKTEVGANKRDFSLFPVVKRVDSVVPDQSCTVLLRIDNTGTTPLHLDKLEVTERQGLIIEPVAPQDDDTIEVGSGNQYQFRLSPGPNVTAGALAGVLELTG